MPSLFSRSVSFKTQYLYEWEERTKVRQTLCALTREKRQGGGGRSEQPLRKKRKGKRNQARTKGGPSPTSIGVL